MPSPPSVAADARSGARFVLVEPSHPGNVGAVARAMKVMGFDDLVLVAPQQPGLLQHPEAVARASGAADVLASARVEADLTDALDGISHACATAMTPRDFGPPTHAPRPHFADLAATPHRVAFVFGSERFGLRNADVYRCHACISIPTAPGYGSLNLAQAVQIVAYEWRCALGGFDVVPRAAPEPLADGPAVEGTLAHWQRALVAVDYLDPQAPKKLMPRLRRLAHRAQLTMQEVHVLRGIARAVERRIGLVDAAGGAGDAAGAVAEAAAERVDAGPSRSADPAPADAPAAPAHDPPRR